ncbi:MAG: AAA family ATPase [Mycobacterium sp.]
MAAEQSVLGGMLLSKDAIADVLEKMKPGDFYRPAHQNVYEAILDLYDRGEPADAVTVAAELDRRGQLRRVGGAPYLHTLISTVPTAANAGYYATIVAEKALLRRLVEAGTRVVQYGYAGADGADVHDIVDRAQSEIRAVTGPRAAATPALADLLLSRSDLAALPDAEPLIGGVLDRGTVALLYGKWGTGKSFIALDWAASVATGRRWQGRPSGQARVLYVAAEGAFGMKARVHAWETGWQAKVLDDQLSILPRAVNLIKPAEVAQLRAVIEWGGYDLVVLDTLARCMVGADENSAKDCGEAVDAMVRLRESTPSGRGVVLGVHHTGKDGKTLRGSSAFEGGADTVYAVTADGAAIVLDREKRKDGPLVDRHELKLDPIAGSGSCVISVHRGGGPSDRGDRLMSAMVQHFKTTGANTKDLLEMSEMSKGTFYRSLNDLLDAGFIRNTGTEKRPFYMLSGK